jgi:hypothetical protein
MEIKMKKIYWIFLFVLILVVALGTGVAQANDEALVPFTGGWSEVYTDQDIILTMGWQACRRGVVQAALTSIQLELYLDDVQFLGPDDGIKQFWGPIEKAPGGDEFCIVTQDHVWRTEWKYFLGKLPEGVYELRSLYWFDHPVTDVADYDGDGKIDIFKGLTIRDRTRIIEVIPRP